MPQAIHKFLPGIVSKADSTCVKLLIMAGYQRPIPLRIRRSAIAAQIIITVTSVGVGGPPWKNV